MYNAIIFDFFGVFCPSIATNWFKKLPEHEMKLSAFQALCTASDLGKLPRTDFNTAVSKLTGVSVDEVAQGIEAEMIINTSLVGYVQELRANGYRIACLSNGSTEWTRKVIDDYDLAGLFEEIVLSGDLGIVKPDPKIYMHTLKQLKLPAAQAIFVDDRETNVVAAETCGIRSLVFKDTLNFRRELETVLEKDR